MIAVSSSGDKQVNLELFDDYCEKPINEPVLIKKMITLFSRPGLKAARPLTERVKKDTMILIVEDNTTNQLVLADKLDELGYKNRKIVNDGLEIRESTNSYLWTSKCREWMGKKPQHT